MTGLTRFSQDMDGSMEPDEDGPWVRYEDVAAIPAPVPKSCATCKGCDGAYAPASFGQDCTGYQRERG